MSYREQGKVCVQAQPDRAPYTGALEEDGREAVSALLIMAAAAVAVVDLWWRWKVGDDEGRVMNNAMNILSLASVVGTDVRIPCCTAAAVPDLRVSVLPRRCVWRDRHILAALPASITMHLGMLRLV